ncbi:MAG TPA: hypothetical protein VGI75_08465 [Pirellulales bacterium]|jgi:hypothetical protein
MNDINLIAQAADAMHKLHAAGRLNEAVENVKAHLWERRFDFHEFSRRRQLAESLTWLLVDLLHDQQDRAEFSAVCEAACREALGADRTTAACIGLIREAAMLSKGVSR